MTLSRLPLFSCLILLAAALSCRMAPLTTPEFVVDAPQEEVQEAIMMALARRDWAPIEQEDGRVRARLNLRSHQATVDIHYDSDSVRFEHVSSVNLHEGRGPHGRTVIHSNYNAWLRNLQTDILAALAYD